MFSWRENDTTHAETRLSPGGVDIKTKNVLNQKKSKPILQNNHAEIKREISCFLFKGYHGDRLSHLNTDTLS